MGDDTVRDVLLRLQGNLGIDKAPVYLRFDGDLQVRHVREDTGGGPEGWRDFLYEINGTTYWDQRPGAQLFGRVQWAAGENFDRPFQLTLGGRESVRGYNEDAYPGSKRLLITAEERIDFPSLSTGFADVGIAVFADSGWKAGVGAGLRLGIPSGAPNVLRIDVGTPLTGERDTKGIVFRVYGELLGLLDRRSWPTQVARSRWYGIDPDLTTRPVNPLAAN
jgi:hemolysin activation/secretion protein